MKAFMVYSGYPQDGCILVFAESHNKAKSMCINNLFCWEYIEMNCKRVPNYDGCFNEPIVIEDNDALPKGVEPFYTHEI